MNSILKSILRNVAYNETVPPNDLFSFLQLPSFDALCFQTVVTKHLWESDFLFPLVPVRQRRHRDKFTTLKFIPVLVIIQDSVMFLTNLIHCLLIYTRFHQNVHSNCTSEPIILLGRSFRLFLFCIGLDLCKLLLSHQFVFYEVRLPNGLIWSTFVL